MMCKFLAIGAILLWLQLVGLSLAYLESNTDEDSFGVLRIPDRCPGYVATPGIGAHKIHMAGLSWNEARKVCIAEGGHLVIIRSHYEQLVIQELMRQCGVQSVWLGVHRLFNPNEWVTVLDESLDSIGWKRWVSNNGINNVEPQRCASLVPAGLQRNSCTPLKPYVCKRSLYVIKN